MGPDGNTDLAGYELIPEEQVAEVLKSVDLPPEVQETVEASLERRTAALNQRFPHGHQRVKGSEEVRRRRARQQRLTTKIEEDSGAGKVTLVKTVLSAQAANLLRQLSPLHVQSPFVKEAGGFQPFKTRSADLTHVPGIARDNLPVRLRDGRQAPCPRYRAGQSLRPGSRTQTSVLCRIITDRAMPFPSTTAPSSPTADSHTPPPTQLSPASSANAPRKSPPEKKPELTHNKARIENT